MTMRTTRTIRRRAAALAAGAVLACLAAMPSAAQSAADNEQRVEQTNRELVRSAFAAWADGGTRFFDILDEDVEWTILGEGPSAGVYRGKADFLDRAVRPFATRISVPLKPTVQSIYADGEEVIILWNGEATARDGRGYRNTYAWFFTMRDGRVVRARALLDLAAYDDVLARVQPAPQP